MILGAMIGPWCRAPVMAGVSANFPTADGHVGLSLVVFQSDHIAPVFVLHSGVKVGPRTVLQVDASVLESGATGPKNVVAGGALSAHTLANNVFNAIVVEVTDLQLVAPAVGQAGVGILVCDEVGSHITPAASSASLEDLKLHAAEFAPEGGDDFGLAIPIHVQRLDGGVGDEVIAGRLRWQRRREGLGGFVLAGSSAFDDEQLTVVGDHKVCVAIPVEVGAVPHVQALVHVAGGGREVEDVVRYVKRALDQALGTLVEQDIAFTEFGRR